MKKRDAIIISVLVNAGLIAVLVIAALTNKQDGKEVVQSEVEKIELPEAALSTAQNMIVENEVKSEAGIAVENQLKTEEEITHKLPEVATDAVKENVSSEVATAEVKTYKEVVVKRGDNLEKIAKANHTTISKIRELNAIKGNMLRIGQVLKIESVTESPATQNTASMEEYYIVKVGDNPWTIAMKHHIRVSDLMKLNNLTSERAKKLKPGDKLRVR